jgi:hypothetical protein
VTSLSLGCAALPEGIPDQPGTFLQAQDARRAWLAASPDNAVSPYFVMRTLEAIGDPDCPRVESTDSGTRYDGDGCTDAYGTTWLGGAVRDGEGTEVVDFYDFGVSLPSAEWTLDGYLEWTPTDEANVALRTGFGIRYEGESSFVAWQEIDLEIDWNDGDYRMPTLTGEIGLEDWGLATLEIQDSVYLGRAVECSYPSGGGLRLEGENVLELDFTEHEMASCGECPTWLVDGEEQGSLCDPLPVLSVEVSSDSE